MTEQEAQIQYQGTLPQAPPEAVTQYPYPLPYEPVAVPPPLEEEEFGELAEQAHWRVDLKWIFGLLAVFFLLATLTLAGFYRVTGPRASREVLRPVVDRSTMIKERIADSYDELRDKARKNRRGTVYVHDIGVTVSFKASELSGMSRQELTDRVVAEVEKRVYESGYRGNLPMKAARGVGEQRATAVNATLLSLMNRKAHRDTVWPLAVAGGLCLAFVILFLAFCHGWGKAVGAGLVLIAATLPVSLFLRIGAEVLWTDGASSAIKSAMNIALRNLASSVVVFFDAALALGALVLLVGVVGAVIAGRTRSRVKPFTELESPDEAVVGGPSVDEREHSL